MTASRQIFVVSGFDRATYADARRIGRSCGCKFIDLDSDPTVALSSASEVSAILLSRTSRISATDLRRIFPHAKLVLLGTEIPEITAREYDAVFSDNLTDRNIASKVKALLGGEASAGKMLRHGGKLVGSSAAMENIRRLVSRLSSSKATALIHGDTGTGKEVVALLLHHNSPCASNQLVPINCAAIPEAMIEGELFGYEKGAFSGAVKSYPGKFRLADGGTLFLDEVGELSLSAQAKILRALETGEVFPLGSLKPEQCSVRVIAATNRDLRADVEAGKFRADLFYRLAVVQLPIPPLRQRSEDVYPISSYVLKQICADMDIPIPQMTKSFIKALENNEWPGNVREMRNAIEHAVATASNPEQLTAEDLPAEIYTQQNMAAVDAESERELLLRILAETGGQKTEAARKLNCSRMTFYRRLKRAGLSHGQLQLA